MMPNEWRSKFGSFQMILSVIYIQKEVKFHNAFSQLTAEVEDIITPQKTTSSSTQYVTGQTHRATFCIWRTTYLST